MKNLPFQPGDKLEAETFFGPVSVLISAISHETGNMFVIFNDSMTPCKINDIVNRVNNGTFKIVKAEELC